MKTLKLVVVGGSSYYTPALIEALNESGLEVDLVLNGRTKEKLLAVTKVSQSLAKENLKVSSCTDIRTSLEGADFILQQARVGGMQKRGEDERFPLELGLIGEETIVPGGASLLARTIPYLKEFATVVKETSPDAKILALTNPNNMVIDYLNRYEGLDAIGFCDLPTSLIRVVVEAITGKRKDLETIWGELSFKYYGINHLAFLGEIKYQGEAVDIIKLAPSLGYDSHLIETLGLLPVSYLRYYYYTSKLVKEAKEKPTRGEVLYKKESRLEREYRASQGEKPEALSERQTPWYKDVVVPYLKASKGEGKAIVVTQNQGAILDLEKDSVAELPVNIVRGEIQRLHQGNLPSSVKGLITSVSESERLLVDAVANRSVRLFRRGLVAHPLVREIEIAEEVIKKVKEINHIDWL